MSVSLPPAKRPRSDSGDGQTDLSWQYAQHPQMQQTPPMHCHPQVPQSYYYSQMPQMHHPQMQPPQQSQQPLPPPNWQFLHGGAPPTSVHTGGISPSPFQAQPHAGRDPKERAALERDVAKIPVETLRKIVVDEVMATSVSSLSMRLIQAQAALIQAELDALERSRTQVLDFDRYSKAAWHELNTKYSRLRASKQYDAAFDAQSAVGAMIDDILDQPRPGSSYGTRKSAVETIRKILKSVCLAGDVVGSEVRKSCYGWDEKFVKAVVRFRTAELDRLVEEDGGQFLGKVRELVALANDYCILEKLEDGLAILEGTEADDEEDEDEDEEDEDEDDNDGDGANGEADAAIAPPHIGKEQ